MSKEPCRSLLALFGGRAQRGTDIGSISISFPTLLMDPTAPSATAAPAATTPGTGAPASAQQGGTPGTQGGASFKDDKERADHYEARHKEATDTIRVTSEAKTKYESDLKRYKDTYGDLEPEKLNTQQPAANTQELPSNAWTDEKQKNWELDQQIGRVPSLVPHNTEIKDLVKGGLKLDEAKKVVAERHNISLGPTTGPIDMMPGASPAGGSSQTSQQFSNEQVEAMKNDGIDPEKAKKHAGAVADIMKRARR